MVIGAQWVLSMWVTRSGESRCSAEAMRSLMSPGLHALGDQLCIPSVAWFFIALSASHLACHQQVATRVCRSV